MESCDDPFLLTTLLTPNIGVFTPRQAIFQRFLQVRSHTDYLASGQTPPMSGSVPEGRPHVRCQSQWQAVTGTPGWPVINGAREPNVKAGCIQRSSCADQPYGHAARTHAEQRKMPAGVASRLLPHAIKGVLGNSLHTAPSSTNAIIHFLGLKPWGSCGSKAGTVRPLTLHALTPKGEKANEVLKL